MQTITCLTELKNAIELLEVEQEEKAILLKEQFYVAYDSLKPINILKSSLHQIISSPAFSDDILGTFLGWVSGFLSKKIVVGSSASHFRKLIGTILQFGVTNFISQHPNAIKYLAQFIQNLFHHKKEEKPE
jgi:hypothetical protein